MDFIMQKTLFGNEIIEAKPFLKWAGGKSQLIPEIELRLPSEIIKNKVIEEYFEPFIGGGALFFYLMSNYDVKKSYISDINEDLIVAYNTIKNSHKELIKQLKEFKSTYLSLNHEDRKIMYYEIRDKFNCLKENFDYDNYSKEHIIRTSYLIFLNKTCFNGLYRVNGDGNFNVPMGKYKNPLICDENNLTAISYILKDTTIVNVSYLESEKYISDKSFVYLDPPYRPISNSASFTSYTKSNFNDENQKELAEYYKRISKKGAKAILSNSDPKNENKDDNFFDDLYNDFSIDRVYAKRFINSNKNKRGPITEILVRNY